MDEQQQIPSLNHDFLENNIPNISISAPYNSLPIMSLQQYQDQYMSRESNFFCGSTISRFDHNNGLNSQISAIDIGSEIVSENRKDGTGNNEANFGRKKKKKMIPQRIAFHTRSDDDVLDDGFKWRKYGQKNVKNNNNPRSYYRCSHHTCSVKKQIQRLSKDSSIVVTTYEGIHNHPCVTLMETLSPLLNQLQFFVRL